MQTYAELGKGGRVKSRESTEKEEHGLVWARGTGRGAGTGFSGTGGLVERSREQGPLKVGYGDG